MVSFPNLHILTGIKEMARESGQKFIGANRAPRVQIEYDVDVLGAQKKVQLPFIMGVMADFSGHPSGPVANVAERSFQEIDVDNFDDRMKSIKPSVNFTVPNELTGKDRLAIKLTFGCMDDFSPTGLAAKIDPLRELLEARTRLKNLISYLDGHENAERLIEETLKDPRLLELLAGKSGASDKAPTPEESGQ